MILLKAQCKEMQVLQEDANRFQHFLKKKVQVGYLLNSMQPNDAIYGNIELGQHWHWQHQAITWTNVDESSVRPSGIHLKAILRESLRYILDIRLKITDLILQPHLGGSNELSHWGWVMNICISKLTIIGSDNGLSPCRRQAIIWTNAAIFTIRP